MTFSDAALPLSSDGMTPGPLTIPSSQLLRRVYASTTFALLAFSLLVIALPFRFQALNFSIVQYGTALAVYAFGMLLTEGLWGAVAFRIGNRRMVLGLGTLVLALIVLLGLASTFDEFLVTLGLFGALVIYPVPLMRWLALTAGGPGTGGRGTGRYGLFFGLGLIGGATLGPVLFVAAGFLIVSLVALASFLVAMILMGLLPWQEARLPSRTPGLWRQLPAVFTRPFAIAATLVTLYFLAYTLTTNFLQYYSVDLFRGTPADAGYVIGAARATQLLAGLYLGHWVDRWGPRRSAPFGFLLMVGGAAGTYFAHSFGEMVAGTLVFATGTGWLAATLLPLALEPVPLAHQGVTVGVFGSFEDLGLLVGPVLISAFYASYGPRSIFPVVAGIALAGAMIAVLTRGRRHARGRVAAGVDPDAPPVG